MRSSCTLSRRGLALAAVLAMSILLPGVSGAGVPIPPVLVERLFPARTLSLDGVEHRYRVFVPFGERPADGWPVILFLHGSGERGDDGLKPVLVGLGPAIASAPSDFRFAVVFAQAPEGMTWSPPVERVALAELEATIAEVGGDRKRLAVVGMSMGGNGALRIAARHPQLFAALVSVCGFPTVPGREDLTEAERAAYHLGNPFASPVVGEGTPDSYAVVEATGFSETFTRHDPFAAAAKAIASLPVWLAHGTEDPVVPVAASRRLARELRDRGAIFRLRLYWGVGHGVWDPAFAEHDLWTWLAAQKRP